MQNAEHRLYKTVSGLTIKIHNCIIYQKSININSGRWCTTIRYSRHVNVTILYNIPFQNAIKKIFRAFLRNSQDNTQMNILFLQFITCL